jgi:hypothetical protein
MLKGWNFMRKLEKVATKGCGGWTQSMHPMYTPSICRRPLLKSPSPQFPFLFPQVLGAIALTQQLVG